MLVVPWFFIFSGTCFIVMCYCQVGAISLIGFILGIQGVGLVNREDGLMIVDQGVANRP